MPARSPRRARPVLTVFAAALAAALVAGCSWAPSITSLTNPYRATVVQGNFVSREQAAALKPGMSRQQVREILGTSLLSSIFHENRWDYVFTFKARNEPMKEYRLTVYFQGDKLERVDGEQMPTEAEFVAQIDTGKTGGKVPLLQATPEMLEKTAPTAPAEPVDATPETPARTSYPPLESPAR